MTSHVERPLIKIVVGSVRPIRVGDQIADALAPLLAEASGARVEIIDLAALKLPMLDEPLMPAMGNYTHAHTSEWSSMIAESDGVVFLTPQYNGGYPASLKNAIDFLFHEWSEKPALIVSYGGHGGGLAAAQLRGVLEFIGLDVSVASVELTLPRESYGADWRLVDAASTVALFEGEIRGAGQQLGALLRSTAERPGDAAA